MISSMIRQTQNLRLTHRQKIGSSSIHVKIRKFQQHLSKRFVQSLQYNRDTGIISSAEFDDDTSLTSNNSKHSKELFHTVIGIEIHAQLSVPTKLFSSSPTKHHPILSNSNNHNTSPPPPLPNTSIQLHDIGYPGTLPLLSKQSVQYAILSAAALQCQIQYQSRFERKHYFYPDLPLGYQVTQQRWPLAKNGVLVCRRYVDSHNHHDKNNEDGKMKSKKKKRRRGSETQSQQQQQQQQSNNQSKELSKFFNVGIDRIQMEQDTGKTTTITTTNNNNDNDDNNNSANHNQSLIDFNRAGCTLIEVVFKPQIKSAHEAASVTSTVQSLLRHIRTCDGKMEDGSLRVDLNISIAPILHDDRDENDANDSLTSANNDDENPFQKYLPPGVGKRVEVKNLNSLKQIIQSVEYEGLRQAQNRLNGNPTLLEETRTYDPKTGQTIKIRDKGSAVDYRFMPEPDLPPLILNEQVLNGKTLKKFVEDELPELPEQATMRLMEEYSLNEATALIITSDRPAIELYEDAVKVCIDALNGSDSDSDHDDDENKKKKKNDMITKVPVVIGNLLCNDLFALVKESALNRDSNDNTNNDGRSSSGSEEEDDGLVHPISMEYSNIDARRLGLLTSLVVDGIVSTTQGKKLLEVMYKEELDADPQTIADARGWKLISDMNELKKLCEETILDAKNEKQFVQYKQGGKHVRKMKKFFIGKIMASSKGNAHPELLKDALDMKLDEIAPGVEE